MEEEEAVVVLVVKEVVVLLMVLEALKYVICGSSVQFIDKENTGN